MAKPRKYMTTKEFRDSPTKQSRALAGLYIKKCIVKLDKSYIGALIPLQRFFEKQSASERIAMYDYLSSIDGTLQGTGIAEVANRAAMYQSNLRFTKNHKFKAKPYKPLLDCIIQDWK